MRTMKRNISLHRFFAVICVLFSFGIGQMWGYTISNNKRVHFLNYGDWNGVYIKMWNGGTNYYYGFSRFGSSKMYY